MYWCMEIDTNTATREEILRVYLDLSKSYQVLTQNHESEVEKLNKENERLRLQIQWHQRQVFGARSERYLPQDSKQPSFSFMEVIPEPPDEKVTVKSYEKSHRRGADNAPADECEIRFDENVPVDEIVEYPEEVKGLSESEYEVIGEKITTRLKQIPCSYRVERTIRKTVKIKSTCKLHTAPAPESVIERSYADVSLLSGLIVDKFQYHLPLYRQHQRMKCSGVHVSRANLTKLVHRSIELLEPIYNAVLSEVLLSDVIQMDETPIKASRKENGGMKIGYFWPVYAGEQVAFVYSSSRGATVIKEILGRGCKKLVSDGYAAYDAYEKENPDVIHANCWAHVRRKFYDAGCLESLKILEKINELFNIERELKEDPPDKILEARRNKSLPIVDDLFKYFDELWNIRHTDTDSLLGKGIRYAQKLEQGLRKFLEHGDIPLSTNDVENQIRPIAIGRKNWLFCWTEVGARHTAMAYTLIQCCKIQKINPWDYINDVLIRISTHKMAEIEQLTPKYWRNLQK